jgi:hypothetical protein
MLKQKRKPRGRTDRETLLSYVQGLAEPQASNAVNTIIASPGEIALFSQFAIQRR